MELQSNNSKWGERSANTPHHQLKKYWWLPAPLLLADVRMEKILLLPSENLNSDLDLEFEVTRIWTHLRFPVDAPIVWISKSYIVSFPNYCIHKFGCPPCPPTHPVGWQQHPIRYLWLRGKKWVQYNFPHQKRGINHCSCSWMWSIIWIFIHLSPGLMPFSTNHVTFKVTLIAFLPRSDDQFEFQQVISL